MKINTFKFLGQKMGAGNNKNPRVGAHASETPSTETIFRKTDTFAVNS